jgi:NAD(P)H-flavin reductase
MPAPRSGRGPTGRTPAPFGRRTVPLDGVRELGAYRLLSVCDASGVLPRAGQFYMLGTASDWGGGADQRPFLGRACSVARAALRDGGVRLDFLLEDVGPGTHRLCACTADDELTLVGPLGLGFRAHPVRAGDAPRDRRALLVGGGVGIAPLAIWQDELREAEEAGSGPERGVSVLLGFRDAAHAAGASLLNEPVIATDDGSVGHHGQVTELLAAELEHASPSVVYACGPPPMLEAVRALCERRDVAAQLALEAGMACGFGACYGCVVPTRDGGYLRVCVDGPVVDAARLSTALAPGHP